MITENEIEAFIKDPIWIQYANTPEFFKKLFLAVAMVGFRVTHGKKVIYEGDNWREAVRVFNSIKTKPVIEDQPKSYVTDQETSTFI